MSFDKSKTNDQSRYRGRDRDRGSSNGDFMPSGVKVYYTGNTEEQRTADLEKALAKFKKILTKEGKMIELREREYYKSPGRKRYENRRKRLYSLALDKAKAQEKLDNHAQGKKEFKKWEKR